MIGSSLKWLEETPIQQNRKRNLTRTYQRLDDLYALIGTGVVSMATLYARVSAITDSVARTQTQLDKQMEYAVDREEYLRRDREIQRALERMATKDELRDVNDTLRSIQESISPRRR
ncbi:MAG: hypothetical protein WB676_24650 [Bryobacteraceae bacterium]